MFFEVIDVYTMAVLFLMRAESLSPACVKSLEFADTSFILFVLLCDCKKLRQNQSWKHRT